MIVIIELSDELARELVRQIREALGDEIPDASGVAAECLAADAEPDDEDEPSKPEPGPQHPGWVFLDRHGDAWGWDDDNADRSPLGLAKRPFHTRAEAARAGEECFYGCIEVREWRPGDRVPPMPAPEPAKPVRYRVIDKDGDAWFRDARGIADLWPKRDAHRAPTFATRAEAAQFIAERSPAFAPYTIVEVPA